ncbi:MAG TPA: hypothetical protein VMJ94_04040 [Nitrososphaera sp.]|nr:hypothetical protein [Nitrososphaera sp.]
MPEDKIESRASADDEGSIHGIGMKHSIFLNNLEQWVDGIISRDGLADKELIRTIKERFESSIQVNVDHHKFMMNNAKENHDQRMADRQRLVTEVYQSLLQPGSKHG